MVTIRVLNPNDNGTQLNSKQNHHHMQLFGFLFIFFIIAIPVMAVVKDILHKPIKHKYDRYE